MSNVLVFSTVSASVANDFLIDYSLMSNPKVTSSYIEFAHKGTVYPKSTRREPPLTAQTIPPVNYNSRMLYVWLTQYSFNTLMYQMQTSGMLRYQIAKAQLPSDCRSYLDTTCTGICLGRAFFLVGVFHSHKTMELSVQSTAMPKATMTNSRIKIAASFKIQAGLRYTSNTVRNLFSLTVVCLICKQNIDEESDFVTLKDKGHQGIKFLQLMLEPMLSYYAACGHNFYAKSARLYMYLQNMSELETINAKCPHLFIRAIVL
ncbi:bactericidal permeability-increasing protein-like [Elysia marginata]|uniref:Bactericidal permeability-increasing protein-like n=1 Tax=Elysia marginata TaxID=1093978 RepID=A0AAV4FLX5_9GAST|nr:bactericidal permeability-increasing protein-like [Elysia marginata]